MENITIDVGNNALGFYSSKVVVNSFRSYKIIGSSPSFYILADSSSVSFNDCQFDDFFAANGAFNVGVQNGAKLFDNATNWPSNGNAFVSYNGGSVRFQPITDALINSTGTAYSIRSYTNNIRRENYSKVIAAGGSDIFTFSMTGSPVSGFVNLRMFGNDSALPNGAIYQEVVFTFHQDGAFYQNSSIINSTQAGSGLTTLPTYTITQAAGVWTVSMTPGASGAIGSVTFIAEVIAVSATASSFSWV
jgi:hypothetical protein